MTIQKWGLYLLGRSFVVKIDHHNLKYLLDKKIGTLMQQKWLSKLLGYDIVVQYKNGPEIEWWMHSRDKGKGMKKVL